MNFIKIRNPDYLIDKLNRPLIRAIFQMMMMIYDSTFETQLYDHKIFI